MNNLEHNIEFRKLLLKKLYNPSVMVYVFICLFSLMTFKFWINWVQHPFSMDVDQYYSYLIAKFIHNDFTFHFDHHFWLVPSPSGMSVPKVTMGMSIMYAPFFVIGNNIAYAFDYDGLGYSAPYAWSIHLGSILYVIIGLWYCRKFLLLFFNEWVVAVSMILILFGTNLFYYTYKESEMTHGHLFFLFSVFIYHVLKWQQTKKIKYVYYFSFFAGLAALVRPTEILILLFPLFIYVSTFKEFKDRIYELKQMKWKLAVAILIFFLPIIPQLIFWKIHTGQFLFFSYGSQEGFFFADPQFVNVLFSWRKGWFIYTPIMLLTIAGLAIMYFKWRKMFIPIALYFLLNLYLICCWWDWGYGGSFGMRALVQCYAFLIIPFAFFINWIFITLKNRILKLIIGITFIAFSSFCCYLNIFQTYLLKHALMHWDSMTKEAYFYTFLTSDIDRVHLETLFEHPNYDELRKGNRDE